MPLAPRETEVVFIQFQITYRVVCLITYRNVPIKDNICLKKNVPQDEQALICMLSLFHYDTTRRSRNNFIVSSYVVPTDIRYCF